ncbi:hypothetical protein ACLB2K_005693 [Fragaria x ananassa]
MDPQKIQSILDWPKPTTVKGLRGLLDMAGYYRLFIRHFGIIAQPLNDLLRHDNFHWTPASDEAFSKLKQAITTAPVLAWPDFSKPFMIETDVSGCGIEAVLQQEKHLVAFLNKWRPYLLGNAFTIMTDHKPLKNIMDQCISTPAQHKWVAKLMGYNYSIKYKADKSNTVPDVLSRKPDLMVIHTTSTPIFDAILQLEILQFYKADKSNFAACSHDPEAQRIIAALDSKSGPKHFENRQGRLYYKGKIYVSETSEWRAKILHEFHGSLQSGHSGYLRTLVRLQRNFSWPRIRKDVKLYVTSCDHCQTQKYESIRPPGFLQPLPILAHNWEDISMDFVEGMPKSNGFNAIMVIVDRLSKFTHFVVRFPPILCS